jgi:transposase
MEHVAIDLGGRESQICVRDATGQVVHEGRYATAELGRVLAERGASRVVMETCAESYAVAAAAQRAGHEVRVVPGTLVRTLGVGARRLKTDRRDAQVLSEVSSRIDLPTVHLRSVRSREHKTLCSMRQALVRSRTQLVNTVRGYLRLQLVRVRSGSVESFAERVRETLLARPEGIASYVQRQLEAIEALSAQIQAANEEIEQAAQNDQVCERLMSVPGVGPVTALRFVATLDTTERFADAHRVASYVGLVPSERSSSERQRRGAITKAGQGDMRWLLVQAAWSLWRTRPGEPIVQWARHIAERRGRPVAIVALARKLGGILFALWRDGTTYDPVRAARRTEDTSGSTTPPAPRKRSPRQ